MIIGLEFPPISHLIEWPDIFWKDTAFAVNKVVLLMWVSAILAIGLFMIGSRKRALVPTGVQNVAESIIDFVDESIVLQTIGPDGRKFTPFLTTLFTFILFCNLWEVIPFIQMPVNARMAMPMFFSLLVWLIFNVVGIAKQGFFRYFKGIMFPPGVPKPIYILVTPIELVSTILVRPLSLAVRLFANMLAGHLVLVTFACHLRRVVGPKGQHRHLAVLVLVAGRPHGVRGLGLVPAGVHLHHPRRRVHRRCHAS